jgi:FlaG/FlaF family flagellin (archaellin)
MAKATSPLISAVVLIAIIFAIAALISPWMFDLATDVSNQTGSYTEQQIKCQSTAYDFDTSFGEYGINWNFSSTPDLIETKISNTGSMSLWGFSFEIESNEASGIVIKHYGVNSTYKKTESDPLKPGQSMILKANITENLNGSLREVKILNSICPSISIKQDI